MLDNHCTYFTIENTIEALKTFFETAFPYNIFLDIKSGANPVNTKVNATLFFLSVENGTISHFL